VLIKGWWDLLGSMLRTGLHHGINGLLETLPCAGVVRSISGVACFLGLFDMTGICPYRDQLSIWSTAYSAKLHRCAMGTAAVGYACWGAGMTTR
jgi:hypothetical protein